MPEGTATSSFTLSSAATARIVAAAALVLLVTVALTVAVGVRLVRPLMALTAAVQDSARHPVRARVTRRDEIGYLTAAFNDLSERRESVEARRNAMVDDIAHELRTPVTNIRGWLEAVEDKVVPPDEALASSLLEEAVHLQHIIEDLEDLAAADAGHLRMHPRQVRIRELVEQVAEAHRARAGGAGVTLDSRVVGDLEVTGDPVRLRQAVGNLVSDDHGRQRPRAAHGLDHPPAWKGRPRVRHPDQPPERQAEQLIDADHGLHTRLNRNG